MYTDYVMEVVKHANILRLNPTVKKSHTHARTHTHTHTQIHTHRA